MAERLILGWDRKCRSCGLWDYHEGEELSTRAVCGHCRVPYGRLALGADVPRRKQPAPKLTREERVVIKAAKLATKAAKQGQYGYRGRR